MPDKSRKMRGDLNAPAAIALRNLTDLPELPLTEELTTILADKGSVYIERRA